MVSLNKVMVIGNVGAEPEMRFTPNGHPVTSFRVATNWNYNTPEGERKQETEWFNVVAWNRLAEQCNQFLNKGRLVYVEGRLRTRSWDDKEGQKHYRTEVIANRVTFLDRQAIAGDDKMEDQPHHEDQAQHDQSHHNDIVPDDIPL